MHGMPRPPGARSSHGVLEVFCSDPNRHSNSLTAVLMPEGHSADQFRQTVLDKFDMSLGSGLSKVADRVFRIGHLGDFNDLSLIGTLAGVEMGLELADVPFALAAPRRPWTI